jgi:hypothetical protein
MTANNRDELDVGFGDLLDGLEQLAQDLDVRKFPGVAWPVARRRARRRFSWKTAVSLAAAAAVVAMLVHLDPWPPVGPAPSVEQAVADFAIPQILIVEDEDSYSIIDLSSDVPLVSFATRDSYSPECVVPLLPEPSAPEAIRDKKI